MRSGPISELGAFMKQGKRQEIRLRAIMLIIRAARLVPWTIVFAALFIVGSFIVYMAEPSITTFGDSAWLMFQVVTTIGLGDFTCTTHLGRITVVLLSVYSVFFFALITSGAVSYCIERMRARRDESITHFVYQLEHLPELSKEELEELSAKIRRLDVNNGIPSTATGD